MDLYLNWHSNADQAIQQATLRDEPESIRRLNFGLDKMTMLIQSWLMRSGGQSIQQGGCDGQAQVPAEHLDELLEVLGQAQEASDNSIACGIGQEPHEAMVALKVARQRGGDPSVVLYTPDVAKEAEQADQTEQDPIFPDEADSLEDPPHEPLVTLEKADRFQLLDLDGQEGVPDERLAQEQAGQVKPAAAPPGRPLAMNTRAGQVPARAPRPQVQTRPAPVPPLDAARSRALATEKAKKEAASMAAWRLADSCPTCHGRGQVGGSNCITDALMVCRDPKYHPAEHAKEQAWQAKLASGYVPFNPVFDNGRLIYDGDEGFEQARAREQARKAVSARNDAEAQARMGKSEFSLHKAAFGNEPSAGQASKIANGALSATAAEPSPPSPQQPPPQMSAPQQPPPGPGGPPQQGGGNDLLQAVGQVLMDVKKQLPSLEKMKKENPQAYGSIVAMTQAIIALAQKLGGGGAQPQQAPMQKAETLAKGLNGYPEASKTWEQAKCPTCGDPKVPVTPNRPGGMPGRLMGHYRRDKKNLVECPHNGWRPTDPPMQKSEPSADQEWEEIKERRKTSAAQEQHKFQAAHWTHSNGHPRCRLCGDEERTGGRCAGAAHDDLDKGEDDFSGSELAKGDLLSFPQSRVPPSTGDLGHDAKVLERPAGKSGAVIIDPQAGSHKQVQNLGWLLRNWQKVKGFDLQSRAQGAGHMVANLHDGRRYETPWASHAGMNEWLNRPVFKGIKGTMDGKPWQAGQDLDKGEPGPLHPPQPLKPSATLHHNLKLPVGTQRGARVKVVHGDGSVSWVQCKAGQITSEDGHPISSRNPGGR